MRPSTFLLWIDQKSDILGQGLPEVGIEVKKDDGCRVAPMQEWRISAKRRTTATRIPLKDSHMLGNLDDDDEKVLEGSQSLDGY